MARKPEQGAQNIWTLPDGRVIYYPQFHRGRGYLIESPVQQRRIRIVGRTLYVLAWLVAIPVFAAENLVGILAFLVLAALVDYAASQLLARQLAKATEPMTWFQGLRLQAAVYPAWWCIFLALLSGVLAIISIRIGFLHNMMLSGLGLGAYLFLCSFSWGYSWHVVRNA